MNKILKGADRQKLYAINSQLSKWISHQIHKDFDFCVVEKGESLKTFHSMLKEEYGLQEVLEIKFFPYEINIEGIYHFCYAFKTWTAKDPQYPIL